MGEDKKNIKLEYEELVKTIRHHMDLYYNQDEPEISDYEYDMLMQRLKEIEKENPDFVMPNSPSKIIGGTAKREAGVKITHNVPMLSIEDVFTKEAVIEWVNKVHTLHPDALFSAEIKIDGLSMTLRYSKKEDGKLHLDVAETRGDGIIGEDVTANAMVIPDVKHVITIWNFAAKFICPMKILKNSMISRRSSVKRQLQIQETLQQVRLDSLTLK